MKSQWPHRRGKFQKCFFHSQAQEELPCHRVRAKGDDPKHRGGFGRRFSIGPKAAPDKRIQKTSDAKSPWGSPHGHSITLKGFESKREVGDRHAGGAFAGARRQFEGGFFKKAQDQIKAAGVGRFGRIDAVVKHEARRSIDNLFLEFDGANGGGKLGAQVVESKRQCGGGLWGGCGHVSLLGIVQCEGGMLSCQEECQGWVACGHKPEPEIPRDFVRGAARSRLQNVGFSRSSDVGAREKNKHDDVTVEGGA